MTDNPAEYKRSTPMKVGKNRKNIKKVMAILIITLCAAAAVTGIIMIHTSKTKAAELGKITYTVKKETYENVIDVSGNIEAAQTQTLQCAEDGTVTNVYVSEGDQVKKGQVLVQFKNSEEKYNLAKQDYDIEQKRITGALKEVALMEVERDMINEELKDRQVIAMFDGIIADLDVSPGDVFENTDELGTLINRDYLKADIEVVETDVSKLEKGQTVELTFPAYSQGTVAGTLVSWPAVGTISSSGATVVEAEVRIYDPPEEILPEYSFTGEIVVSEPISVLLVERYAVNSDKNGAWVEVQDSDGAYTKIEVKVVPYDDTYVKIVEGDIGEGDVLKAQKENKSGTDAQNSMIGPMGMGGPGLGGGAPPGGPPGGGN